MVNWKLNMELSGLCGSGTQTPCQLSQLEKYLILSLLPSSPEGVGTLLSRIYRDWFPISTSHKWLIYQPWRYVTAFCLMLGWVSHIMASYESLLPFSLDIHTFSPGVYDSIVGFFVRSRANNASSIWSFISPGFWVWNLIFVKMTTDLCAAVGFCVLG